MSLKMVEATQKNGKKINIDGSKEATKMKLIDAPNDLEDRLKKASEKNPVETTIRGFFGHCEGGAVSIGQGRKAFAKDINAEL